MYVEVLVKMLTQLDEAFQRPAKAMMEMRRLFK